MKKLRSILFLCLAFCCFLISANASDFTIHPNTASSIAVELCEPLTIHSFNCDTATYQLESRSTGDGLMRPADTAYGATFVKDTVAKVSFIVEGCRSDQYLFAILIDENAHEYVTFIKKLSEINISPEDYRTVNLPIDLKNYGVPLGTHTLVFGIIDEDGNSITGSFDALEFSVVSKEIPLTSVAFYDAYTGFDLTEITLCPGEDSMLGLVYTPENATGTREVVYESSNEAVFTVTNIGGYAVIEPVSPGKETLTATVNGKITASISVSIGHDYVLTETVKAPTCTTAGSGTYQCSYCGAVKEMEIAALGHNYGSNQQVITQAATACAPGKGTQHCLRCNQNIEFTIPAIFSDTKAGRYYADAVDYLYSEGIINGMSTTQFGTDTSLSRGMLVTFLYRLAGKPDCDATTPFTDVESGRYFTTPIAWAYSTGIAKGTTDTTFEPMKDVTREELAAFLYRYGEYRDLNLTGEADLNQFPDASKLHNYAKTYVSWAVSAGIISGSSENGVTMLLPRGSATRAQAATMLYRYLSFEGSQPEAPDDSEISGDPETPSDSEMPGNSETPDDTNDPTIPDEDGAVG